MIFYRYEAENVAYAKDLDGDYVKPAFPSIKLKLKEYDLVKETPKGYWVGLYGKKYKFVLKDSKKKFAYLTKEEAMTNYIKRTESRIKILKEQLQMAEMGLSEAKYITT